MTRGQRIYALRKARGLTMEEVGKACGVAKSTVRKWETNFIESMRADKLQALADVLQASQMWTSTRRLWAFLTGSTSIAQRPQRGQGKL